MIRPINGLAVLAIVVVFIILHGALFTVDPTEEALILRFDEPVR